MALQNLLAARRPTLAFLAFLLIAPLLFSPNASAQSGLFAVSRSLDQLIDESDLVVRGYVISIRLEPHPQFRNLRTVLVSMSISNTYKGTARKSLVFRQYVWGDSSQASASGYQKGEELILLLRPVSQYGLTSPAGLEQGRFTVIADNKSGQKIAVNGRGNIGLFDQLQQRARSRGLQLSARSAAIVSQPHPGSLPVDALEDLIRIFARTR